MRTLLWLVVLGALAGSGCATRRSDVPLTWEDPSLLMAAVPANTAVEPSQPASGPPKAQPPIVRTAAPTEIGPPAPITAPPASQTSDAPQASQTPPATPTTQKLIVTPENAVVGKVATVNQAAAFVVLSFPVGHMPAIDQRLSLYRRGLKVGEVKVTGPQIDENVVADIIAGDSDVGDEVK